MNCQSVSKLEASSNRIHLDLLFPHPYPSASMSNSLNHFLEKERLQDANIHTFKGCYSCALFLSLVHFFHKMRIGYPRLVLRSLVPFPCFALTRLHFYLCNHSEQDYITSLDKWLRTLCLMLSPSKASMEPNEPHLDQRFCEHQIQQKAFISA